MHEQHSTFLFIYNLYLHAEYEELSWLKSVQKCIGASQTIWQTKENTCKPRSLKKEMKLRRSKHELHNLIKTKEKQFLRNDGFIVLLVSFYLLVLGVSYFKFGNEKFCLLMMF